MFFVIQELTTKRSIAGTPKEIITTTKIINNQIVNSYTYSDDKFVRPIKKAYRITLHDNHRVNGAFKKNQYVICTLNYYDIAESCIDDYRDIFDDDILWYKILDKITTILESIPLPERYNDIEEFKDDIFDKFASKVGSLFDEIISEFKQTKEFEMFKSHFLTLQKYTKAKEKFNEENFLIKSDDINYDICYDIYGNLKNSDHLNYIQSTKNARFIDFAERNNFSYCDSKTNNHEETNDGYQKNKHHITKNNSEKDILKKFYYTLAKTYHPDSNSNDDATAYFQLLNTLKSEWGI